MEKLDFFSENEIDYIERNLQNVSFYDLCKSLRAKLLSRTGRTWSDSALIKEIRKINPKRKRYILTPEPPETEQQVDKERIQNMNINRLQTSKILFEYSFIREGIKRKRV